MLKSVLISFFTLFSAGILFSQGKDDTISVIKEALEISDIKEPVMYVKNIRAVDETDRILEKIKKGNFYVRKGDKIDAKDGKAHGGINIDSLILAAEEIKYLVQKLETPTIWQDSLFSNSIAFTTSKQAIEELHSINKEISSKPEHYFYMFSKPVFFEK